MRTSTYGVFDRKHKFYLKFRLNGPVKLTGAGQFIATATAGKIP